MFFVSYFQGKYAKKAVPFFTQKQTISLEKTKKKMKAERRHLEQRRPI